MHLSYTGKINFGSFYTLKKYVEIVEMWLKNYSISDKSVIFDFSCGYGVFFEFH